jgi:hypothetical protein
VTTLVSSEPLNEHVLQCTLFVYSTKTLRDPDSSVYSKRIVHLVLTQ